MNKYVLIAAAGLLAAGVTACAQTSAEGGASAVPGTVTVQNAENNIIRVTGSEEVRIAPDIAELVFSVDTQEKDAAKCQEKNSTDVNTVTELLKSLGIEEKSIQITGLNLNPRYDWSNDRQTLIGYEMRTSITVSDVPLDLVGTLLTESVSAGVNNIESIAYQTSKYDENYQEALKLAIAAARSKAEAMAEAGNCTVGAVTGIEEHMANQDIRYSNVTAETLQEMKMSDSAGAMNVMPGELSVEASVTVEYRIQ